jgi:GTP-binding protein
VKVELAHTAADPPGFPTDGLPEIALLGRSNVGKSSFLNALVGRRSLARTGATPGKTRLVHFYRVEDACYLVELPGYGHAPVSKSEQRTWRPRVESYLRGIRRTFVGALLLVDVRRDLESEERDLLAWLARERIPANLVLTKSDELKPGKAASRRRALAEEVGADPERLALVSSKPRRGPEAVAELIHARTARLSATQRDGRSRDSLRPGKRRRTRGS